MAGPLDSETLYRRKYTCTIRNVQFSDLRCSFKVTKTLKPQPNQLELKVYNLAEHNRLSLENMPEAPEGVKLPVVLAANRVFSVVKLEAGYEDGVSTIFIGEVRAAHSVTEGADIVTELTSGDGEKQFSQSRIHMPLGPATPLPAALAAIVNALGVGPGNLPEVLPKLAMSSAARMYVGGTVLSGSASDEMDAFCRAANLDWSIQDGKLLILERGVALKGVALVLSSQTGLIESPTVDSKGVASFKTLMIPNMYPGRLVIFAAKHLKGAYRVEECTYMGDTHGREWYIDCKAKKAKIF